MNEFELRASDELGELETAWGRLRPSVLVEARRLLASNKLVRFLEPECDLVLTIERSLGGSSVIGSLGFPFALASRRYEPGNGFGDVPVIVNIRRTGPTIDDLMAAQMNETFLAQGLVLRVREVESPAFRSLVDEIVALPLRRAIYADQFHYLGDAIQHLSDWDRAMTYLRAESYVATTRVAGLRGILGFGDLSTEQELDRIDANGQSGVVLVVVPCYIESHWAGVVAIAAHALGCHPGASVLIPGRNLVVRNGTAGDVVECVRVAAADYVLSRSPVERMVAGALGEFFGPGARVVERRPAAIPSVAAPQAFDVVLAPFASEAAKVLTPVQLLPLRSYAGAADDCRWSLLSGDPSDPAHARLNTELAQVLAPIQPKEVGMREAIDAVAGAGLVIAADSALSHAARRLGVASITLYNRPYWDGTSPLSLLHRSPVGFGTADHRHFHLATDGNSAPMRDEQCQKVARLIEIISGARALDSEARDLCVAFLAMIEASSVADEVGLAQAWFRDKAARSSEPWLVDDLSVVELLEPFRGSSFNELAMARWLAELTTACKLGRMAREAASGEC